MATALAKTAPTGAPYIPGDVVAVEFEGSWRDVTIQQVSVAPTSRFGLRWVLAFEVEPGVLSTAYCDDNGRNHTWRQQVCPSFHVRDDGAL